MSARETGAGELKPVDMMLFCPKCGFQHVDAPTPDWTNPPHRSHLCHECGCVWRPADVPTNGVAGIQTFGAADTVFYNRAALSRPQPTPAGEIVERLNRKIESVSAWMTSDLRAFYIEIRDALEQQAATIAELREWALEKSATHHRLAHESEHLRAEHIASSAAYRELAEQIEARATLERTRGQ
jgi:hypothetical protein